MPPKRKSSSPSASSKRARPPKKAPRTFDLCPYIAKAASSDPSYSELQTTNCQTAKPKLYEQCQSCIERQASLGACRFSGSRLFKAAIDDQGNKTIDYADFAFRGNQGDAPLPTRDRKPKREAKKPKKEVRKPVVEGTRRSRRHQSSEEKSFDESDVEENDSEADRTENGAYATPVAPMPLTLSREDAEYALPLIAPTFTTHLERELRHEAVHLLSDSAAPLPGGPRPVIRIQCTAQTRSMCDMCVTSVFYGSYMCGCCGREFCLGCWEEWTPRDTPAEEINKLRVRDQCSRSRRHERQSMLFITRAKEGEIAELLSRVRARIPTAADDQIYTSIPTMTAPWPTSGGPLYLPVPKAVFEDLPLTQFQSLWSKGGIPLVLTSLSPRFQLPWDARYFINQHGTSACLIHDCTDSTSQLGTVAGFFSGFSGTLGTSYKLKDWPPTADFKDTFPLLFADLENALPYPTYTRRSGPLNLAAHFPPSWNAPDLGPKMYNAYPAPDFLPDWDPTSEIKGTTNLHLDLTDAVNIMLHASGGDDAPESSTIAKAIPHCGAVWDIFPPSSASAIRTYLHETRDARIDDPIHRQLYYLTETDLISLKSRGVGSYRVFQNPGDAVFIPAGCPHQVRNRMSCVKVAVDFLSPENVRVCKGLIEEARRMAPVVKYGGRWGKEDVLQLWGCLGFSWAALEKAEKAQ
jgi:hypothetical protein